MGKSFKHSAIQIRVLSAALIIPVFLGLLWLGDLFFAGVLAVISVRAVFELWRMSQNIKYGPVVFLLCSAYVGLGFALCYHLRQDYGFYLTLVFFVSMWASDIGAYFSGKFIGGAKMSPGISPNKTWAGYCGALILPALVVLGVAGAFSLPLLAFGLALGVAGQAGDLFISWLKRDARMKDTGSLIPGHGGILDRIDSLIPAIAVFLAALKYGVL